MDDAHIDEKKWGWHSAIIDDDMDDPPGELQILQGLFATTEEAQDADANEQPRECP
jgi:hypothetical protein